MKLLSKVLVAIDFEKETDELLKTAKKLHEAFHSHIILVHVLPGRIHKQEFGTLVDKAAKSNIEHLSRKWTEQGIEDIETIVKYGSIFDQIIDAAEEYEVNAIIAGAGEKQTEKEKTIGTSIEKVMRKTDIPVWVVRSAEQPFQNLLCPVDFSEASARALNNAIMLARVFNAELKVLSVFEPETYYSTWIKTDLEEANLREQKAFLKQFDEFLNTFDFGDIKWQKIDAVGEVDREIIQQTGKHNTDLLLMGTTGKTELSRILMGSTTEKVIREVACSVITTKSQSMLDFQFEMRLNELAKHYQQGVKAMEEGDLETAQIHLELAYKEDAFHVPTLVKLHKTYKGLNKHAKAREYKQEAVKVVHKLWDEPMARQILEYYGL